MENKILVFDLGGVLMKHNISGCVEAFKRLMGENAMREVLGLRSDGEGTSDTLMEKYERGDISTEFFISTIKKYCSPSTTAIERSQTFTTAIERSQTFTTTIERSETFTTIEDEITAAWITMHDHIPAERLEFVRQLRESGYHTYLLSNNNDLHWRDVCRKYPIYDCFDGVFLSHEMHLSKPDPEMFRIINDKLHNIGKEIIFIDDLAANRQAAEQAVGWKTTESIEGLKSILAERC